MATIHEANRRVPRLSDILRDYPLPAWALDHPYRTDRAAYERYMNDVAYARMRPMEIEGDFDLNADTVRIQLNGPTPADAAMAVARVIRELDWQYMQFQRIGVRPTDLQRAAIFVRRDEMDLLRRELPWVEWQRQGFQTQEGAAHVFRGYPVVVV